jgi:hypothetical protein
MFVSANRSVPRSLILNQPSQLYFPGDVTRKEMAREGPGLDAFLEANPSIPVAP